MRSLTLNLQVKGLDSAGVVGERRGLACHRHDSSVSFVNVACHDELVNDSSGIVCVSVVLGARQRLHGITTMEVF